MIEIAEPDPKSQNPMSCISQKYLTFIYPGKLHSATFWQQHRDAIIVLSYSTVDKSSSKVVINILLTTFESSINFVSFFLGFGLYWKNISTTQNKSKSYSSAANQKSNDDVSVLTWSELLVHMTVDFSNKGSSSPSERLGSSGEDF